MTFQNPGILWFLSLLLVPIIVHLFDFVRSKRLDFSNVKVLTRLKDESGTQNKLRRWILLLTRVLGLFLIIMGFSGPTVKKNSSFGSSNAIIYFDNTVSTLDLCGDIVCLEQGKELIRMISKYFSFGGIKLTDDLSTRPYSSPEELELIFESIGVTAVIRPMTEDAIPLKVIVSDFQQGNDLEVLADSTEYWLVPLTRRAQTNVFIDTLYLTEPTGLSVERCNLHVDLSNSGNEQAIDVLVRLLNDDRQVSSKVISIDAQETSGLDFELFRSSRETYSIQIGDKEVTFDDSFYLTIPPLEKVNVAIVSEDSVRWLSSVYNNLTFFDVSYHRLGSVNFERISDADLLILEGLSVMPSWYPLEGFAGNVVIIPDADVQVANYKGIYNRAQQTDTSRYELSVSTLDNPFFEGVFDGTFENVSMPIVQVLYEIEGNQEVVLGTDRYPFLTRKIEGDLETYTFAGPVRFPYSSLSEHSIFLPVMYKIAEKSRRLYGALGYEMGNKPIVINGYQDNRELTRLIGRNKEFIPEVYSNENQLLLTLPEELNEPGHYFLLNSNDTLATIAINYPRTESLLNYSTEQDLRERYTDFDNVKVLSAGSSDVLYRELEELNDGKPLWKYALILGLMFLLAEIAIIRWRR